MTGMINDKALQETPDLVKAKRAVERSSMVPYEDPQEFGRRVAIELFEKHVKNSEDPASSESGPD